METGVQILAALLEREDLPEDVGLLGGCPFPLNRSAFVALAAARWLGWECETAADAVAAFGHVAWMADEGLLALDSEAHFELSEETALVMREFGVWEVEGVPHGGEGRCH